MRFIRTAVADFDSSGFATAVVSAPSGTRWSVEATTVSTTSTVRTTASIYLGSPSPGSMIDSTYSGNRDTSDTRHEVIGGESITCVWTGGTPGTSATLRVTGEQREGR